MAEFKRSRLIKKNDEEITRKTVFLGLITVLVVVLMVVFGLPLLIRVSVILGDVRSKNDVINEKVLPPPAPRLIVPYEATNSAKIKVGGVGEKGMTVELFKNDVSIGKTSVNDSGDFTFEDVSLDMGDNEFLAISTNEKGVSSDPTQTVKIAYDNTAPSLELSNPSEAKLSVDYADFDVVGKSDKGVSVTINSRVAMVDSEGKFKLKFQLAPGKNELNVVATDLAGNTTQKKIEITYDI